MNLNRASTALLAVLTAFVATWFLRETFVVSMPLAAACFVAAVVWPLYRVLSRRVGWVALPASMAAVVVVAAIFFGAIAAAVAFAVNKAPEYQSAMQKIITDVGDRAKAWGVPFESIERGQMPPWVREYITVGFTSLWSMSGYLVLIFFFTALILMEARRWASKTQEAFSDERAWRIIDTSRTVSLKVRQYLLTQTLISLMSGVIEGTFLWLLGVELAFAWGLLFFVLNFIPNLGSVIALIPPTLITLVTMGPMWAVVLVSGIIVIETTIGYVVSPMMQGKQLSLSPLIVLLSVVFWGWVWGLAGAILAVPLTVTLLITFAHVDALKPLALLMSAADNQRELKRDTTAATSEK